MTAAFADFLELLTQFLDRRPAIVDRIEQTLLNVRDKETARIRQRDYFDRRLTACFFDASGIPAHLAGLKGRLAAAHLADGFEPVVMDRYAHELDPLELIVRAYQYWDRTRWPGRSGRTTYAETVYAVAMLRHLEHLSLRIWDDGPDGVLDRLDRVQELLDRLNSTGGPNVSVRDVAWVIQIAQGPLTRHPKPYFAIAQRLSESPLNARRLAIHTAGARLAGGHLRSQLHYRAFERGKAIDDAEILAVTRNSNSMDLALLVHDLLPLFAAYDDARLAGEEEARLDLADAILQGVSADPELCLTRLDLLGPSTSLEELFVDTSEDGPPRLTPLGEWHRAALDRYAELIARVAEPLGEDASRFNPARCAYSPYGILYGFCADILSNMAMGALLSQPSLGVSLEDLFEGRSRLEDKLARARGWQALPKREDERDHFEHSLEWAAQVYARVTGALAARARRPTAANASEQPTARLFVVPASQVVDSLPAGWSPPEAVDASEHCLSSDLTRALAGAATPRSARDMATDWKEGRFLASAEANGEWFGVSKVILTLITSRGQDALIHNVPATVVQALRLTCPDLAVFPPLTT